MGVDWSKRGDYIVRKHGVTPEQADEALADRAALVQDPDPASRSGVSVRTIGHSESYGRLLTVITVTDDDGTVYGVNAWRSNDVDTRKYQYERGDDDGQEA
ncbi:transposase [Mycolicibacterium sp.]|uniref:transposase n=1 Tax=Mycolicibacterium sp. TaxID=2320850 RepID=UPI00355E241E